MEIGKEEHWEKEGIAYAKKSHDNAYFSGFHRGRHKLRDTYVNSKWLILDPSKINDIKLAAEDPCINCENRSNYLKIGCTKNPKECKLKQKQFLAIELLTYFK